jgi:WD40 repeat protein
VCINGLDKSMFLSIANTSFYLWNVEQSGNKPVNTEVGSVAPLFAACWSADSADTFVFGGVKKSLKMIDRRSLGSAAAAARCVVWKADDAHADSIRDVQWSPLVPHWFATAADDGCVKVWDVRYGATAVRTLQAHTNSVRKVTAAAAFV